MEKSSAPFSLGGEPIWNGISIRGNVSYVYTMVHQCTKSIVIGSFLKGALPQIKTQFQIGSILTRIGQNSFP